MREGKPIVCALEGYGIAVDLDQRQGAADRLANRVPCRLHPEQFDFNSFPVAQFDLLRLSGFKVQRSQQRHFCRPGTGGQPKSQRERQSG